MRVLVAGEQHEFGDLLLPFLAKKGHTLLFAQTVDEFIVRVSSEPLDVIIMDLDLPAKDGFTASEELKGQLEAISRPVIVVADNTRLMPHLKELGKWLRQNATAILYKPVDHEELEKEVARVLGDETAEHGCLTDETLSRMMDAELAQEEVDRAQLHLLHCRPCERRYEESQKTDNMLKELLPTAITIRGGASPQCILPGKLTAYFKDGLSPDERTEVEMHLARCSYCTSELVALYKLMKEFDEKDLEPDGKETLNGLRHGMSELLHKGGSVVCIRCFGSIPPGSARCMQCDDALADGVSKRDTSDRKEAANGSTRTVSSGTADNREVEKRPPRSKFEYLGTRKVQVAASLLGLAVAASALFAGSALRRNRELTLSARNAADKIEVLLSAMDEEIIPAGYLENSIEEEIEIFGQFAMYEPPPVRFEVPENVERIARTLVKQHYYDRSAAEKASGYWDIWDVFEKLNRLEAAGSRSPFRPRCPNRIFSPAEIEVLKAELSGGFTGIGVIGRVAPDGNGEQVIGFAENSSARSAGLQTGDIIREVDGKSLSGLNLRQMVAAVRGPVNTRADLRVSREGVPDFEVRALRESVRMPVVRHALVASDTAYVSLLGLVEGVVEELSDVLNELRVSNIEKLILDLRGNAGSSLETATHVAAFFLPEDTLIVTVGERSGERRVYAKGPAIWEKPLILLVDNKTISGGELVAAALQGTGRAVVIGNRTPGKGSVQTIHRVAGGYAVQVTTAVLAGPEGLAFDKCGVEPDIQVAGMSSDHSFGHGEEIRDEIAVEVALESFERVSIKKGRGIKGSSVQ